jgi:hypothetical protein
MANRLQRRKFTEAFKAEPPRELLGQRGGGEPRRWWQHVLHNQTALLVKGALLFRRNIVVADVPYLLRR